MELAIHVEKQSGYIEWIVNDGEFITCIGVWFDERKRLADYDGVFELPKQAIPLIRKAGYIVPKEFTKD